MKILLHKGQRFTVACLLSFMLGLSSCGESAEEIYETAQFEELQNNKTHARKLYERILRDHGDSPYAAQAKERLAAMDESPAN